ncbi:MAG: zinc-ribbon domain-containing protein, partial [Blastocatellia bacterium]
MYCPNCGLNQDASKRFCTVCGTNLHAVNQPLPARWPLAHAPSPADPKGLWELP